MTTKHPQNLATDLRQTLAAISAATGITAGDIVTGTSRALGHVNARHAAFWLLSRKGHAMSEIALAFGQQTRVVRACVGQVGFHSKARDVIEKAQAHARATAILNQQTA